MLALLLLCVQPVEDVVRDRVDSIELNHFYDDQGRLVFDQVIFRDGDHVCAWRLWRSDSQTPHRCHAARNYSMVWFDGDHLREVRAPSYSETWTQDDPELDDRSKYPAHKRRGLRYECNRTMPQQPPPTVPEPMEQGP